MLAQEILRIPEETEEYINHMAYEHVLDGKDPLYPDDECYMSYYYLWDSMAPNDDFLS